MNIKRNKKVTIKLAISQEELDGLIEAICDDLSGNIEDVKEREEYSVNGIVAVRSINKLNYRIYGLSLSVHKNDRFLDLESSIIHIEIQRHINSYNQSIEQEKQIRQDQRDGY